MISVAARCGRVVVLALLPWLLGGCSREETVTLPGLLEWERVAVLAETAEPVRELRVREGDEVRAGDVLLLLDARRTEAELAALRAEREVAHAQWRALRGGVRRESLDAVAADVARLRSESENALRERDRVIDLQRRGLAAEADVDRIQTRADAAAAALRSTQARQREMQNGSRREDVEAAAARVAALDARIEALRLARERLTVTAPRDGRVDALPFRVGDQPVQGATLVSLLAGEAPYVRVFVPAAQRAGLLPGARFTVSVEGVATPFPATLRSIRSDAAFTPYYALVGDDASRLVYRAELQLSGDAARQLPAGLPASATPVAGSP